ncbi:hypothetical protein LJC42_00240 [Eubacteriales bacterium OttesenSCG-928-K08]|nr:hypothetical protein [Eubacteriales bacterium OttesenSCG-928-K08]
MAIKKVAIVDTCLPITKQSGRGMSARYLQWELQRNGVSESSIEDADIIFASCQSTESYKYLQSLRNKFTQKIIISGGAASTSPYTLGKYSDMVCVGDGQRFIETIFLEGVAAASKLDNVWIDGETRNVEIDQHFPFDMPPIQGEDGAYRLWCGRGCKNKCKFCQTGWAYEYKENPNPVALIDQSKRLLASGKKINYLSNDISQHTFYNMLPAVEHGSYSIRFLKKTGLPPARQVRLGIEGVSERLRSSVSKPISHDDLIGCTTWLNENKKSVRWFMIAGLPGETERDWQELKLAVQQWKKYTQKGVLALSFTAFCPDPATPLCGAALDDTYWDYYIDFKKWFFDGHGWSNRVKLMNPQQPKSRMQKAIASTGMSEDQLREGGHMSPNSRLNYPYAKNTLKAIKEEAVRISDL